MNLLLALQNCKNAADCLKVLTMLIIVIIINMVVLRFLWNKALVRHVTILKPITTLGDAFVLALGLTLLRSNQ